VEKISWENRVERHSGLTFLVTQSSLQSAALVAFTRLHKQPLVNSASLSVHLVRRHFNKVKSKVAKNQNDSVFRPELYDPDKVKNEGVCVVVTTEEFLLEASLA
jgi:hypothetical protein